jgi:hemolysin III
MNRYFRHPTSGFTHLAGAVLSFIGLIVLIRLTYDEPGKLITIVIYGTCMILLYLASTVYHLWNGSDRTISLLVRFDLIGIYLLIAGTYTPVVYHFLDGWIMWTVLALEWTLALGGIIYVAFIHRRRDAFNLRLTLYYVLVGGVGLLGAPYFVHELPIGATLLLLAGGATYLVGTVVFAMGRPNLHRYFNAHDLWHIFVMGGSVWFFAVILHYIALA